MQFSEAFLIISVKYIIEFGLGDVKDKTVFSCVDCLSSILQP